MKLTPAWFKKLSTNFKFSATIVSLGVFLYLTADYTGPEEIVLKPDTVLGFDGFRAQELIVQGYDQHENLYAIRGMIIYQLKKGGDRFIKLAHVPTGFSFFWFRNFSFVRRFTLRPECMEVLVKDNGDIIALSAGRIWTLITGEKKFKQTLQLKHYRKGDQGIFDNGLVMKNDSTIFFGEYFRNDERQQVCLYGSTDGGLSWRVNHMFKPGDIRHIHALHKDPFEDKMWICTGDKRKEPRIGWTDDNYKTINVIGSGSQMWRATQLVFDRDYVYWGADTYDPQHSGIYRWHRKKQQVEKMAAVDGVIFHSTMLKNRTIVMTTNREGGANEKDKRTKMLIIEEGRPIRLMDVGTWYSDDPGFWFKFAKLRLQRNQGAPALAITCLSQKEFSNGELLLIPEESIAASVQAVSDTLSSPETQQAGTN